MMYLSPLRRAVCALAALFVPLALPAQVPQQSEDVMLQAFYWDSQRVTSWAKLAAAAPDLSKHFSLIWLPPSAAAEGGNAPGGTNVGYHPRVWNDQNSCWGTQAELCALIAAFHREGARVLADVVVNHRAGYTDWGNFPLDDFGAWGSYQLTAANICRDDEMNTSPEAGAWRGQATGAPDTGEGWGGARDLDHTSPLVQADCRAYLSWLRGALGYDGFRYDFVKGYGGQYVGLYNAATAPYLSVGEYWDGSYDLVKAWIAATGYRSMAFDFPQKYAALNNGLAAGNYAAMAWREDGGALRPAGLAHHASTRRYAVTFVDNHDTYRDGSKYTGSVAQAYAFILSSPGIPCVFYPHWLNYRLDLAAQIAARRLAGVHAESEVSVTHADTYYECYSQGLRGTLIARIGAAAPTAPPEGYYKACGGNGWAYFLPRALTALGSAPEAPALRVEASAGQLVVQLDAPACIAVYNAAGACVQRACAARLACTLPRGVYVVRAGKAVRKVKL